MSESAKYLDYILECCRRIAEYTTGGRQDFISSHLTRNAVMWNLVTLGDAGRHLPVDAKARHGGSAWSGASGLRNILAHDYLAIDYEDLWDTVERDIPVIEQAAKAIRSEGWA